MIFALIALNFYSAALHGPAGTAQPSQFGGQGQERPAASRKPADHGHNLSAPAPALSEEAHHPVIRRGKSDRRPAVRSGGWAVHPPKRGGIDQAALVHSTMPFRESSAARWQLTKCAGWISTSRGVSVRHASTA